MPSSRTLTIEGFMRTTCRVMGSLRVICSHFVVNGEEFFTGRDPVVIAVVAVGAVDWGLVDV